MEQSVKLWVSTPRKGTGQIEIDEDWFIRSTPPIWRRFVGQPYTNLLLWLGPEITTEKL